MNVETEVRKHTAVVECGKSLHNQGQEPLHQRGAPLDNESSQFPLFRQIGKPENLYGLKVIIIAFS
jgi:hypothetical protein